MQIGQLAQRADVAIDTVRYYERHGILPKAERQASGYRRYGEDDVARLRFVGIQAEFRPSPALA